MNSIVVVGGGLAGTLVSNQVVGDCNVTLLEIGPEDSYSTPQVVFKKKRLAQVDTFCHGKGGTTNLWHNGLIPIQKDDLLSPDFAAVLEDSKKYTDQVASSLFFTEKSFCAEYGRISSELNASVGNLNVFNDGIDCLVYPKHFKRLELKQEVDSHYFVHNIEFIFADSSIAEIKFTSSGKAHSIKPDVVVVSAGALGTPGILDKIITASGNKFPEIGTGFIDHPIGFVGKVRFDNETSKLFEKLSVYDQGNYVSRNAIRIKSDCGKYTCCVFFRPALTMHNSLSIYKFKSLLGASKGTDRLKNMLSPKLFHPDIVAEIISHLFSVKIPGRIYNIFLIAEQRRGTNRVYHENGEIVVDWCISDEELMIYRQILNKLNDMLLDISENLNIKTDITEDWLWSSAHHSCTTPMGNAEDDLIDSDLKLKFCDNVYVCDGSVIQEHSYANTGLTIGQLAFRLADKILSL